MKLLLFASLLAAIAASESRAQSDAAHPPVKTTGSIAAEELLKSSKLSPSLKELFSEDQYDRENLTDWHQITARDTARRASLRSLIATRKLRSGEDYEAAAFMFQHGSTSNDYLFAHTLSIIAVSKGRSDAVWISAATLDRYLESQKQPQIFGTQYVTPPDATTTQEPYDRTLISDALRADLRVPALDEQQALLRKMVGGSG